MRTLPLLPYAVVLIISISFSATEIRAQDKASFPEKWIDSSTLSEILKGLDETSLPRARISLKYKGRESYDQDNNYILFGRLSEELIFSQGFRLLSVQGCRVTLRNEQVKIIGSESSSYNRDAMSFARFLYDLKHEKKLTAQTGVMVIGLNQLKYTESKPYQYTKKPDVAKVFGVWRVKFCEKRFVGFSLLQMEISAAEDPDLKDTMKNAQTLTFTFDDKQESESFRVELNRAIKLCQGK
jgi:hypothetical protein